MNADIALWLIQDGVTTGAIYALLALALLLVFAVTRIIFVPQGDFISYAGLTLGMLQLGQMPGTVYLLVGGGALVAVLDGYAAWRERRAAPAAAHPGWSTSRCRWRWPCSPPGPRRASSTPLVVDGA